jgi:hypothetical protein
MYYYEKVEESEIQSRIGQRTIDNARWVAMGAAIFLGLKSTPEVTFFKQGTGSARAAFATKTASSGFTKASDPRVWVSVDQGPKEILKTVAHEVAHQRQYAGASTAELLESQSDPIHSRWESEAGEFEDAFLEKFGEYVGFETAAAAVEPAQQASTADVTAADVLGLFESIEKQLSY